MVTLNISPSQQVLIEQASQQAGMTLEQYIITQALSTVNHSQHSRENKPKTLADCVAGKKLDSFRDDSVAIQRALRDEWD
ncbi:hypothetical protein [Psychrobacter sp. I-STPA10]|uniref:hypothetical protein n=1 Tax=Psychrobacter sp. I-STPA10 TaxID=2585769 RepID=UPI001E35A571|nr:hypothetical protein [Psychrobacter sp. I-STPA10]